jgi:hypothetical protein
MLMDWSAFRASLDAAQPPALPPPLVALWWDAKGNWQAAHEAVQAHEGTQDCDWVHAYLHRKEGDLPNAGYWYRRARRPEGKGALEAEWEAMARALLGA